MNITSKIKNHKLWTTGAFGNRLRVWNSWHDLMLSGHQAPVSIRYLGDVGGQWCEYDVPIDRVEKVINRWWSEGADICNRVIFNESAPDEHIILQGEYLNDVVGDSVEGFTYSTLKGKMRDALKEQPITIQGLGGRFILKSVMNPSTWADFDALLEKYPGHVIEVSVYSRCLGDIPGRNALVWEVRRY